MMMIMILVDRNDYDHQHDRDHDRTMRALITCARVCGSPARASRRRAMNSGDGRNQKEEDEWVGAQRWASRRSRVPRSTVLQSTARASTRAAPAIR